MSKKILDLIGDLELEMLENVVKPETSPEEKSIMEDGLKHLQTSRLLLQKQRMKKRTRSPEPKDKDTGVFVRIEHQESYPKGLTTNELESIFQHDGVIRNISLGKGGQTAIIEFDTYAAAKHCLDDFDYYRNERGLKVEKQRFKK
jgi:hypothetical protein